MYKKELNEAAQLSSQISDENLIEQEKRFKDLNNEVLQSIQLLAHDYKDLISITDKHKPIIDLAENKIINFEEFNDKIGEFNKIIMSLRMIYLEQESLDNFLRYIISSNNRNLPVDSIDDPRFVSIENEVNTLENETIVSSHDELNKIKLDISKKSQQLFNDDCKVKELCIETSEDIETCFSLLNKIEDIQSTRKKNDMRKGKDKINKITETYDTWNSINQNQRRNERLIEELKHYNDILMTKKKSKNVVKQDDDKKLVEFKTLASLKDLLQTYLLPKFDNVENLDIQIEEKLVKFNVVDKEKLMTYAVYIELDESNSLRDIKITHNEILAKKVLETFYNETNIYNVIYHIVNKI